MRTDSSGEITLTYEADTERFHRYKGHKSGKEVTVYIEKAGLSSERDFTYIPAIRSFRAIISIEDKPKTVAEVNEERRIEKSSRHVISYGMSPQRLQYEIDRQASIAHRTEMLRLAKETNHLLGALLNERTKNNPRRSAKKRS